MVGAITVLAVTLSSQGNRLATTNRELATATKEMQRLDGVLREQRAALTASKRALAALTGRLDGAEQRLQADEKQLQVQREQLPPDVSRLARQVAPSVVVLHCSGSLVGSGFSLALPPRPGYSSVVVTAAHVVHACADSGGALTLSYQGLDEPVRVCGVGEEEDDAPVATLNDVALLDVKPRIKPLQPARHVTGGQFVMVIGTPILEEFAGNITTGVVSKVAPSYFLHTAPEGPGNSGGPLVDRTGRALGVVRGRFTAAENLNVAMRLMTICRSRLLAGECPY
jgi:S1-C subfamily serine protease